MTPDAVVGRRAVTAAKRIVVKVGSSSLTTVAGGLDPARIAALVDVLAATRERGAEVVLVSSGAIAAGLAPLGFARRPTQLADQQAAASVGQGLLVHRYTEELGRHGIVAGQVLLTVDDVTRRSHYRNAAQTFEALLARGVLPIVNENDTVATSEIRFGDNDRLAALVANLVDADLLLLLSDVDGLYTAPPGKPGAELIAEVEDVKRLGEVEVGKAGAAGVGTGGMVTKIDAARISVLAGIPVVLTSAEHVVAALAGEPVGTFFRAREKRQSARSRWLAHASASAGSVTIDQGAARALKERGASLLAVGITAVTGSFEEGDTIDVLDPWGKLVGRGLSNYTAAELPSLLGQSDVREVIHRDSLVLL